MKYKTFNVAELIVIFCFLLTACGRSGVSLSPTGAPSMETSAVVSETGALSSESSEEQDGESITEDIPVEGSNLREQVDLEAEGFGYAGDFSEGLAWVRCYRDPSEESFVALVDREGTIIYKKAGYNVLYMAPVKDGFTFIRLSSDMHTGGLPEESYYEIILDSKGVEHYRTEQIDGPSGFTGEHIICHGGGKFVAIRHTSGISENQYVLGTIDSEGNVIDDFTVNSYQWVAGGDESPIKETKQWVKTDLNSYHSEYYDDPELSMLIPYYMGDGIYRLYQGSNTFFYIPTEQKLVCAKSMDGAVVDGMLLSQNRTLSDAISFDALLTAGAIDDREIIHLFSREDRRYPEDLVAPLHVRDGLIYIDHSYLNVAGDRVLELSQYAENQMWCSAFHDGYALMIVYGADRNYYATIIDRNGTEQFEPIRITYEYNTSQERRSFSIGVGGGYFVVRSSDNVLGLYDLSGKLIRELGAGDMNYVYSITDEYIIYGYRDVGAPSERLYYLFFDDIE